MLFSVQNKKSLIGCQNKKEINCKVKHIEQGLIPIIRLSLIFSMLRHFSRNRTTSSKIMHQLTINITKTAWKIVSEEIIVVAPKALAEDAPHLALQQGIADPQDLILQNLAERLNSADKVASRGQLDI